MHATSAANRETTGHGQEARGALDFLVAYTLPTKDSLPAVVQAFYYLPHYYKLVVTDTALQGAEHQRALRQAVHDEALMSCVSFSKKAGKSDRQSSFSFADVVLQGREQTSQASRASIRLVKLDKAASPEAIASAILRAAR